MDIFWPLWFWGMDAATGFGFVFAFVSLIIGLIVGAALLGKYKEEKTSE